MRLIDAEELLERFKWYEEMPASPYSWDFVGIKNVIGEVPTIEVPRWIPVTERLPEKAGEYLVAYYPCYWEHIHHDTILIGLDTFRGKTAWAKRKHQKVTHWMPLPDVPKDGER